ncbi:MAG: helix-turn-helix transcriptional regulator, partial [Oscillibacter sp.]|nr:helix-turn-helix transcriptional regulator [Oscillibacter sp.]
MTFGEKLQKLRAREGLSQDALAELLNVSRQAVSRWER